MSGFVQPTCHKIHVKTLNMSAITNSLSMKMNYILPSSSVVNDLKVSSPKPCLFPVATDILYIVYGVRLFNLYVESFPVVLLLIREFFFVSLIQNLSRLPSPVFCGAFQVISTLVDWMLVTVRFVGLSGNKALKNNHSIE